MAQFWNCHDNNPPLPAPRLICITNSNSVAQLSNLVPLLDKKHTEVILVLAESCFGSLLLEATSRDPLPQAGLYMELGV